MQDSDVLFLTNSNKTVSGVNELSCPEEIRVPQGVEVIAKRAFADCPAKSIILPDTVREIGFEAFAGSDALEYVRLPKNLESMGQAAFRGCLSLNKIDMSDTIAAFSESMFEGCVSLKDIPFRDGILELPRNVFAECSSIESLVIPESVAVIRSGAAGYCENLQTVVLPAGLKLIEDDAFFGCPSLAHIRFSGENPAFFVDDAGCLFARHDDGTLTLLKVPTSAREISIPKNVVKSSSEAFQHCDALEKVYLDCPLLDHPIFVALKTELVDAKIIDSTTKEEEEEPTEEVSDEEVFAEDEGAEDEPVFADDEAAEEDAVPEEEASEETAVDIVEEQAPCEVVAPPEEPVEPDTDGFGFAEPAPAQEEVSAQEEETSAEEEPVIEEEASPEEETSAEEEPSLGPSADDLLADILGQNVGADETPEEEEDELRGVTITPEELDEAVMRGIQEEDEAEKAARLEDARRHKNDGTSGGENAVEEEAPEVQEPRFVYGMESMSKAYEVLSERALYPERSADKLDSHEPNEMEDITTLVVVTEKLSPDASISEGLKRFSVDLARAHNIKRVYFFGELSLDNDEFLFGFGKFALYRNVLYVASSDNYDSLSKEIKSFADIAELQSPVTPFQNVTKPNALDLTAPFKVFVYEPCGEGPSAQTAPEEPPVAEKIDAAPEPVAPKEPTVVEERATAEDAKPEATYTPGSGLLLRALKILGRDSEPSSE